MPRDARLDDFDEGATESDVDSSTGNEGVDASAAKARAHDGDGNGDEDGDGDGNGDEDGNGDGNGDEDGNRSEEMEGTSPDRVRKPSVVPTTEWTPEGGACADCGAIVERRWRQDGAYVCPDCKTWNDS